MAKHKSKFSREVVNSSSVPLFTYPAVSVIIPLYNVEQYVDECLDSLLAQTFKNFEVIVVDDCSTDNSCAVVESYLPKFNGRLKLAKTKKNTGGAGFPRNKGIELSHGEYVYFIDPDDTITPTALEELYSLAKNYDADVVHCEKWYQVPNNFWHDVEYRKNLTPTVYPTGDKIFIKEPTLLTEDFAQRALKFSQRWLTWSVCLQLVRRDFISNNEIRFENICFEDFVFTICSICSAKRYLVVPNVIYFYRQREGSAIRSHLDLPKLMGRQIKALTEGIKFIDGFLIDTKIFAQRPDLKYMLFDMFTQEVLGHLYQVYLQVPTPNLDELLRKEFGNGDNTALMSFIFSALNVYRLQLMQAHQRIAVLEKELKRYQT